MSKRLIVTFPDSVAKLLHEEAERRELSMSFILREAFTRQFAVAQAERQVAPAFVARPRKERGKA